MILLSYYTTNYQPLCVGSRSRKAPCDPWPVERTIFAVSLLGRFTTPPPRLANFVAGLSGLFSQAVRHRKLKNSAC